VRAIVKREIRGWVFISISVGPPQPLPFWERGKERGKLLAGLAVYYGDFVVLQQLAA
jgi:hypothetical protein